MSKPTDKSISDHPLLTPLAERMRPETLEDIIGQDDLLAADKPLGIAIRSKIPHSLVLWGPPGSGKTTLARIISRSLNAQLLTISGVDSGIKEIREATRQGKEAKAQGQATVLFVDEVHRFNKSQQDVFLPHVERGDVTFIGATTENPSFELNSALLSRLKVYVFKPLHPDDIRKVIARCLSAATDVLPASFSLSEEASAIFSESAGGDARRAINFIELAVSMVQGDGNATVTASLAAEIVGQPIARFDKRGDVYYELISALHKSIRGSDPDASLYWLTRMLRGGCDPLYIARRIVRIASEDIGNADPNALNIALNAWDAYQRLGTPEGELSIAQAVIYLACSPKSNASYKAFNDASKDADRHSHLDVPMHLRNAPTQLMKGLGYGDGYRYAHDEPDGFAADENYFPEGMQNPTYYRPVDRGVEKRIRQYLESYRNRSSMK
ncbi:MAG: replication-associated recombination protein A [Acidiferrobacterales bacterium]|nr:replication-associated recombination protein A [Acidiferrobacterales bacterium]